MTTEGSRQPGAADHVRSVAAAYLVALVLGIVIGLIMVPFVDMPLREHVGWATAGAGLVLLLTGGNIMERATTVGSSKYGVAVGRHRADLGREYGEVGGLTGLGQALVVGIPLLVVGAVLV